MRSARWLGLAVDRGAVGARTSPPEGAESIRRCQAGRANSRESRGARAPEKSAQRCGGPRGNLEPRPPAAPRPNVIEGSSEAREWR
ncbi:hypothetical protein NDU88_004443 [Pleurodeles waltl]|uniref:Uncharacterized protein n=1 Tax=Pleurodeles waltl TaxID=8319 RepID=A0AAV7T9K8_PLEWA|nr:hypothetical protein NDU88_004443 [Pleurodeles waltl]